MGGLVMIIILAIIWIADSRNKKNMMAYYDEKINEASITGDIETASRYIELKSKYSVMNHIK